MKLVSTSGAIHRPRRAVALGPICLGGSSSARLRQSREGPTSPAPSPESLISSPPPGPECDIGAVCISGPCFPPPFLGPGPGQDANPDPAHAPGRHWRSGCASRCSLPRLRGVVVYKDDRRRPLESPFFRHPFLKTLIRHKSFQHFQDRFLPFPYKPPPQHLINPSRVLLSNTTPHRQHEVLAPPRCRRPRRLRCRPGRRRCQHWLHRPPPVQRWPPGAQRLLLRCQHQLEAGFLPGQRPAGQVCAVRLRQLYVVLPNLSSPGNLSVMLTVVLSNRRCPFDLCRPEQPRVRPQPHRARPRVLPREGPVKWRRAAPETRRVGGLW